MSTTKPFIGAMKEFFSLYPGQTLKEFGSEVKELSLEEKKEFYAMLQEQGIECTEPKK